MKGAAAWASRRARLRKAGLCIDCGGSRGAARTLRCTGCNGRNNEAQRLREGLS